ncbi:hypothetical protein SAMN05518801_101102 [Novosphingobium sp. CF614]|uniref:hypothetical protein n=1 Tax=Novosphingobium sp. CF614 TaxID=1884364 RepID=UPI0008E2B8AC|nr:hypothetical protein [Novosphingobium sp. CF614]SFF73829.1 hypothetical protein SAMN05518801_101102 [Novosphingobium sp. CF614]
MIDPTPVSARRKQGGKQERKPTGHWRTYFLVALAETSNVTAASAAAGVHPSRAYKACREEPGFAREWRAALLEGYESLELELLHRLRFGEPRDGEVKFDNAAALRLLGLHRETVARERAIRENEDLAVVRASIQAKLARLREQVLARRARPKRTKSVKTAKSAKTAKGGVRG